MQNIYERVIPIRISINDDIKVVQFWFTREEGEAENRRQITDELFKKLALDDKYRKVTYISGSGDLFSSTNELIRQNFQKSIMRNE